MKEGKMMPIVDFNRYVGKYEAMSMDKMEGGLIAIMMGDALGFNKLIVFHATTLESVHRIDFKEASRKGRVQIGGEMVALSKDLKRNITRIQIDQLEPLMVTVRLKNEEVIEGQAVAKNGEMLLKKEEGQLIQYINLSHHQAINL